MKKTTYKIRLNEGGSKEIEGYVFNERWGIDKRDSSYYVLTYIPNGCFVTSTKKMKTLKLLVQEPEFFDFDESPDSVLKLKNAIGKYFNKVGWGE